MTEHHTTTPVDTQSFSERHYFLIRRLHSLTGLVPVGVFLFIHLATNASILLKGDQYQKSVDKIHALGPLLEPVEIVGIFLPLLFHSLLGFQIMFTAKQNVQHYPYHGNVRYALQRWTGVIAFFFIMYHVWQMHWLGKPFGGGEFDAHNASASAAKLIQGGFWVAPLYAIGILASVYHLANGIWTSLITWGITIRPASQRTAGYVCAVFGVLLGAVGLAALSGFKMFEARSGNELKMGSKHTDASLHP